MKLKLDENLGERGRALLEAAGHDVATVSNQAMTAASDEELFQVCGREARALVTLDLDFSNPFRFPPDEVAGVAVLRPPKAPATSDLDALMNILISGIG